MEILEISLESNKRLLCISFAVLNVKVKGHLQISKFILHTQQPEKREYI
jgi:hypothetical protein